jgi:hypothetical protein
VVSWSWLQRCGAAALLSALIVACQPSAVPAQAPGTTSTDAAAPAALARKCPRVALAPLPSAGAAKPPPACFELPDLLRRELAPGMAQQVRGSDAKLQVRVEFPCSSLRQPPVRVLAVQISGHGGGTRVVELQALPEHQFRLRTLRVQPDDFDATSAITPGHVAFSRADVPEALLAGALDRVRTALAARISTERTPPPPGQVDLGPIETSDDLIALELLLRDGSGHELERSYHGYVDNLDAASRVPVQFAWSALAAALPEAAPSDLAEDADRALLRAIWSKGSPRPWYAEQALLALATAAGSPPLIPYIVADLDAEALRTRALAVTALAAISGWDVRRDASGKPRPLPDVVADYRRECTQP